MVSRFKCSVKYIYKNFMFYFKELLIKQLPRHNLKDADRLGRGECAGVLRKFWVGLRYSCSDQQNPKGIAVS